MTYKNIYEWIDDVGASRPKEKEGENLGKCICGQQLSDGVCLTCGQIFT